MSLPYDQIAFAQMRGPLTKILTALELLENNDHVDRRICAGEKDFHFGSLFRCSVSMWDKKKQYYAKSGNAILEKFIANSETREVAYNCTDRFLSALPSRTKLVLLLGNTEEYIEGCKSLFKRLCPEIRTLNQVAYSNGRIAWVHAIHAKALGDYIPQWVTGANTAIGRKFQPAFEGVVSSGVLPMLRVRT